MFQPIESLMQATAHRAYPHPGRPWVMGQTWTRLLFAHWRIPFELMRPLIPADLTLETFDGSAWIGIVPFYMSNVRARGLVPIYGTSEFCELNVRTYVTDGKKSGVWFFSLDASNPLAVWGARNFFRLPYYNASMSLQSQNESVHYRSHRTHANATAADFEGVYRPISQLYQSQPGTLLHWLTERYSLYTTDKNGALYRGEIHHKPWSLQDAQATIQIDTMTEAVGIPLPDEAPLLHYSERIDMVAWYLEKV